MKLMSLLLFVVCMQVAARSEGQTITFSGKSVSVKEVFRQIQKQTNLNIMVDADLLEKAGKVSINVKNAQLEDVLALCFKGQPLTYSIVDKTIVVRIKTNTDNNPDVENKVPEFIDITGKITDEKGEPLVKVSVLNLTTKKGTTTANDGSFQIQASPGDILYISYVGYKAQQIKIGADTKNLQVKLELTEKAIEEVILTGYQQIKKSQMTGAVAKVKAEDLVINGTGTVEQILQGKLSGVEVTNVSGEIGTRQKVRVRGTSTLLGNQEPVWAVDGIIQEDPLPFQAAELNRFGSDPSNQSLLKNYVGSAIAWLNPNDIEEVTVLKDAASTAIFGVKAANGVILITTKKGKSGRAPSISYNANVSTQAKLSYDKMNLMNSKERVDVSREVWERGLVSSGSLDQVGYSGLLKQYLENKITYDQFNSGVKQLEVNNTDWFDLLFQNPVNQSHSVSVSGGGVGSTYYASFGHNSQQSQAKGNGQKSYMGSINYTANINSKLTISSRISGNYTRTTGFFKISPYNYAATTTRVIPAYNPDGSLSFYRKSGYNYNIINELNNSGNENINNSVNAAINVRYRLPLGFQFESSFGLGYSNLHAESYASELTNSIASKRGYEYGAYRPIDPDYKASQLPIGGELAVLDSRNTNYTWRNQIQYGKTFNKKHAVTGLIGQELRSNMYKGFDSRTYGYLPDRGKIIVPPPTTITNINTPGVLTPNGIYSLMGSTITDRTANYLSYYLNAGYTYDERYVVYGSIRGDASNRFGQDPRVKFKPIWAVGAKWNVAREHWFEKTNWLNDFSIRASYGFQGNVAENFGPDLIARIPSGTTGINPLTGEPVLVISSLPYSNLRWEKTQSANIGFDMSFFDNRITSSFDYYTKKSKDLIIYKDVPFENGILQMPLNGGTMMNSGWDLSFNVVPVRTKNLVWSFGLTTSRNTNKLTSRLLPNPTWEAAKSGSMYVDGYPVSSFWVFDFKGLDSTGRPTFNIPDASQDPNAKTDATAYMVHAGKFNPDFTAGFNTAVRFKGLTVSTNLYVSLGGKKILAPMYASDMVNNTPNEYNNLPKQLVYRWRKPGDELITNIPALPYNILGAAQGIPLPTGTVSGTFSQNGSASPYTLYNFSNQRVVNASYLRMNNVSVNYLLPESWCKKIRSKNLSVTYTMSNVFTIVSKDYEGVDPEVASGGQPIPRNHVFSLAVTF